MPVIYFSESQRFTSGFLWLLLIVLQVVLMATICYLLLRSASTTKSSAITGLALAEVVLLLVTVLVITSRLTTTIKEDGIYARFAPFQTQEKRYEWKNIRSCFIRQYKPVKEYGGWGMRSGGKNGNALNVSGDTGIQVVFANGNRLLIGTQHPAAAAKALQQLGYGKE